ncbi:MAG: glycosyltransferase family 4 protein [Planctomycetes bacterium]|nr:glycosyltransferase family 4 protein [Planctomycetota bacterium]
MRVLFLAHKAPFPLRDGYNLHNYHHVRELARRHEIHLVAIGAPPPPPELAPLFRSMHLFPARAPTPRGNRLTRAVRSFSVHEVFDCDPRVLAGIEALRPAEFDVVWTGGIKMLVYSHCLAGARVLGDVADDETGPARTRLANSRGATELLRNARDLSKITRYQKLFFQHLAVCTVVAEGDRDAIARLNPGLDVRVVSNGVDHEYFAPRDEPEEHPSLVFEGNMGFAPNVEGVLYFAREVLPLVLAREPRAKLYVVGKDPAPAVRELESSSVHVTGVVDDVRPYLARGSLFVCPLVSGTGIKNKILQAWSMAKCVVATSKSCGGLVLEPDRNIVVADGSQELARTLVLLLGDPERRRALGARARETVLEHYTWSKKSAEMDAALTAAANAPRNRTGT